MDSLTSFQAGMAPYHPEWIDGSKRGSGMNATWRISVAGTRMILKTYDSRRNPLQSVLTEFGNRATGLTSYAAEARCCTERECLRAWREAGFEVPAVMEFFPSIPLPSAFLAMEEIHGSLLLDILADTSVEKPKRRQLLERFLPLWAARHAEAVRRRDPRLVQEHGTFAHVFVDGNRFVTFDLEVAYCCPRDVQGLVGREIRAYLRSLAKRLPAEDVDDWFRVIATVYPEKALLKRACDDLLRNRSPFRRFFHKLARLLPAAKRMHSKYEIAQRLEAAMQG